VIQANKRAHVPSFSVAVMSQAMMQAVGINAQIEVLEWATQLDRYNSGNYQMSSFTYSSRLDPALSYEQFSGNQGQAAAQGLGRPGRAKADRPELHRSRPEKAPGAVRPAARDDDRQDAAGHPLQRDRFLGRAQARAGFTVWEGKPLLWNTKLAAR
jgi:peptide/nickel transport system substrate-binding protein